MESITCLVIFFYLDIRYFNSLASLSLFVYALNIFTYFGGFWCSLPTFLTERKHDKGANISDFWPSVGGSFIKGVGIEGTYIESVNTKSTCLRGASTINTYLRGIYARGACNKGICIEGNCIASLYAGGFWVEDSYTHAGNTYIRAWDTCGISTYIKSTCASQNFKMRDARLKTWVRASCTSVESTYIGQILEVEGTELKI